MKARLGVSGIAPTVALMLLVGGCGSDEPSEGTDTSLPSVAPTTVIVSTTTSSASLPTIAPDEGPETACEPGSKPLVFAYEQATGALRWAKCTSEALRPVVLGATEQLVYITLTDENRSPASASSRLVALDSVTGADRWSLDVSLFARLAAGSLDGAGVLLTSVDGGVAAVDAVSGTIRWRFPGAEWGPIAGNESVAIVVDPSVAPSGATVVTTGPDGSLPPLMMGQGYSGLDRATGSKLWSTMVRVPQTDESGYDGAAIDRGVALLGPGWNGLDAATGAVLWTATPSRGDGATGYEGTFVFGGQSGPVSVLNIATGEQLWTAPGSWPYGDAAAIGDSAVYALDGNDFVAYEINSGSVRWRQPQDAVQLTWPWHATDNVLFTMWWNLEARATDSGAVLWNTNYPTKSGLDGPRMASIATNDDLVAVGFVSGTLDGD